MDPATALGVASSAVSLIEFACKLITLTSEIRKHGDASEFLAFKQQAHELETMHNRLCTRNRSMSADLETVLHAESTIDVTIDKCTAQTTQLIACLTKVTTISNLSPVLHIAKDLKRAFKVLWEKSNVEKRVQNLQEIRATLNSQIMMLLNEKVEGLYSMTGEKLARAESLQEDLRNGQRKILEAITFTEDQGHSTFTGSDKPVAVILTLDNGEVETMNRQLPRESGGRPDRNVPQPIVRIGTTTTFRSETAGFHGQSNSIDYTPLARSVLDALYFRTFKEREERVADAHAHTFEWINNDETFQDFLEQDRDFYWITGKPGSGKSTLVKFIHGEPIIRERLVNWAGNKTLVFNSFYFWNAGTSLQKSQVGLLRSMLLSVLRGYQHLIPTVFPELCRLYNDLGRVEPEMSLSELKAGFIRLTSGLVSDLKFCFLVDGLDEYSGDHAELCDFLLQTATSPHVKFIVSSRPWGVFAEAFDRYPFIRMQDLTRGDIMRYAEDMLVKYVNRWPDDKRKLEKLIEEITLRASGVFLWVVLVVRELRRGLQSYDDMSDLYKRLDTFPTDLKEYYRYMYNRIDVIHRPRSSKLLLTLLRTKELPVQGLLSVMQMSFAESETLESALHAPHRRLEPDQWIYSSETSRQQIENKTLGLVDADVVSAKHREVPNAYTTCVDFLHRTVYDFFLLEGLKEEMKADVAKSFDPSMTLLACYLVEIKGFPRHRLISLPHDRVVSDAMNSLRLVRYLELERQMAYPDVMRCIDESMEHYWSSITKQGSTVTWAQAILVESYGVRWSQISTYLISRPDYFLFLSVMSGCVLSVASRARQQASMTVKEKSQILSMLIFRYFNDPLKEDINYEAHFDVGNNRANFVTVIGMLLEYGADPEAPGILSPSTNSKSSQAANTTRADASRRTSKIPYSTPWEYFLGHVALSIQTNRPREFWQSHLRRGDLSLPEATNLVKIYQHFLNSTVNFTEEAETTLLELGQLFDESVSSYSHEDKRQDLEQFRAEYQKTKELMNGRRMRFIPRAHFRVWWDLRRLAPQQATSSLVSNIIIGLLLLYIAYLSRK